MEIDPHHKSARLGEHIPGFRGYGPAQSGETDLQFRRVLTAEVEKVRDRLAGFISGRELGKRREAFATALRETAALKDEIAPTREPPGGRRQVTPAEEESLLDFDLALLENVAALHTPLDRLEGAASEAELESAIGQYIGALAEIFRLFRLRGDTLSGGFER